MSSKLGFTTMATPGLAAEDQILVARQFGFSGIDFRVLHNGSGEIDPQINEQEADRLQPLLQDLELPGLLCYNRMIKDGEEEMVRSLIENMLLAYRIGCGMIRVFTGKIHSEDQLLQLCGILQKAKMAASVPVKMGLQIHKNNGLTVEQGLKVCRKIDAPWIGLILSPDQSLLAGEEWLALLPEAAEHTFELYVADVDEYGRFCLIGEGVMDYRSIVSSLRAHGFDGYVTLKWEKCWFPELPDYPVAFSSFLNYFRV